jgi:hypothetical protein
VYRIRSASLHDCSKFMLDWVKKKLRQKKVAERMHRHMETASGPQLHRSAISMTMAALEDETVQEEMRRLPPDQQEVFMMVYECFLMWSFTSGLSKVLKHEQLPPVVAAMRDHFAGHAWYRPEEFEKLWDQTEKWMPAFAKPSEDGKFWPAAALVQIPNAAGSQLTFVPDYTFGCHVLNTLSRMADIGRFTAEQELAHEAPKPDSALEAVLEAGSILIVGGYRRIAQQYGCAPSTITSDKKIIEIYSRVLAAFKEASERRREQIPAVFLNRIVLKFLQVHEMMPEHFFDKHLQYELDKYVAEGLRPEYKQELPLF